MIDLATGNARWIGIAIMALFVGLFIGAVHWVLTLWNDTPFCEVCLGPTPCYDHGQAEKERVGGE